MKKPVVKEKYEEIVFHEPHADFYARVKDHVAIKAPERYFLSRIVSRAFF